MMMKKKMMIVVVRVIRRIIGIFVVAVAACRTLCCPVPANNLCFGAAATSTAAPKCASEVGKIMSFSLAGCFNSKG